MNKTIIILFIASAYLVSHAQVDTDAIKALDNVAETMKSSDAWEMEFTYTIKNKQDNSEHEQSGSIIMKGDKYIFDLLGSKIYYDGNKNYNYIKDANEVNILPPEDNTDDLFFTKPSNLFSFYKEGYKAKYTGKTKVKNEMLIDIDLFPDDLEKEYFRINILIIPEKYLIRSITVYNKNGVSYKVELTNTNAISINDSEFTFNPDEHPGVEVIDMTE